MPMVGGKEFPYTPAGMRAAKKAAAAKKVAKKATRPKRSKR